MFSQIYGNIPGYDEGKTLHASPDYYHIVNGNKEHQVAV